jgi:hypothetical protein
VATLELAVSSSKSSIAKAERYTWPASQPLAGEGRPASSKPSSNLPSTRVEKTIDAFGILKFFYYLDLDGISLRSKPPPPPPPFRGSRIQTEHAVEQRRYSHHSKKKTKTGS